MTRILIFISLFFLSASAFADANDGEYLGFKLGERYSAPRGSVGRGHITGALVYAVDAHKRHQHIGSLSIYVSPKSSIIGSIFGEWYFSSERSAQEFMDRYMDNLEKKYSDWKHERSRWHRKRAPLTNGQYQLWTDLEQRPPIVDHWPSSKKFRVSVALVFAPESEGRSEWMTRIKNELNDLQARR